MAGETPSSRKKPSFLRNDWHKKIKLGSTVKKNRKWKGAKGLHNKLRLGRKGHSARPKVGWGQENSTKNQVSGLEVVRVENVRDLSNVGKGQGALIANVGKKKRTEILAKASDLKIQILNKYKDSDTPLGVPRNTEGRGQ